MNAWATFRVVEFWVASSSGSSAMVRPFAIAKAFGLDAATRDSAPRDAADTYDNRRYISLALFAGLVDLFAAAALIVSQRLDAVLFQDVTSEDAGGDGSEQPPGSEVIWAKVALHFNLVVVLLQHSLDLVRVEIVVHERAVEIQAWR